MFPDISNEGTAFTDDLLLVPRSNRTVRNIVTDLVAGEDLEVVLGAAVPSNCVVAQCLTDAPVLGADLNCEGIGRRCPQLCELKLSVVILTASTGVKITSMFLYSRH